MGRIIGRPWTSGIAKAMKRYRPAALRPMALKRCSGRSVRSGRTMGPWRNACSMSVLETPCFAHFGQLPSSQSNPVIASGMGDLMRNVYTFARPMSAQTSGVMTRTVLAAVYVAAEATAEALPLHPGQHRFHLLDPPFRDRQPVAVTALAIHLGGVVHAGDRLRHPRPIPRPFSQDRQNVA